MKKKSESFKLRHDRKIVLIFISFSIAIFVGMLLIIAINNKVFKARNYYYTVLDTANGLSKTHSIFFKGYEIGKIKKFRLNDQNEIVVDFFIYKEFESRLHKYSAISKNINPISGQITEFELITPLPEYQNQGLMEPNQFIPEIHSKEGRSIVEKGYLVRDREGLAGIIAQINGVLNRLIEKRTPDKINESIAQMVDILKNASETVASYNSKEGGQAGQKVVSILAEVKTSVNYMMETLKEIHTNRKTITPLIIQTTKTLRKAEDTLQGINNNPLIKGGISKDKKNIGVEISE